MDIVATSSLAVVSTASITTEIGGGFNWLDIASILKLVLEILNALPNVLSGLIGF